MYRGETEHVPLHIVLYVCTYDHVCEYQIQLVRFLVVLDQEWSDAVVDIHGSLL